MAQAGKAPLFTPKLVDQLWPNFKVGMDQWHIATKMFYFFKLVAIDLKISIGYQFQNLAGKWSPECRTM
jgi:hypothetical protein